METEGIYLIFSKFDITPDGPITWHHSRGPYRPDVRTDADQEF
jgi:hypothetical protein